MMADLKLTPAQWRELRVQRTEPKSRRLTFVNRKGGSGKTTSAVQLARAFSLWGLRARITDGDAQLASSTYWLPPQRPRGYPTLLDVFKGEKTLAEVTAPTAISGVTIVPSLDTLARVESERPPGSDLLLADEYDADADAADIELLDAAPSMGLVTVSMLAASTDVVVMVKTSTLDLVGAAEMTKPLDLIRRRLNPALRITAVLMIDDDENTTLSRTMVDRFAEDYPDALVHRIPHSVRAREAPGAHQPILDYAPDNPVSMAYWRLAARLVPRLGLEWKVGPDQVSAA
jgi:chromosome partitioning protein